MNFRSPLHRLVLALGVAAVLCAQLFGVARGFLCVCSGTPVATWSDHCHGPHDGHCDENALAHSASECPDGDSREHTATAHEFEAPRASGDAVVIVAPVWLAFFTLEPPVVRSTPHAMQWTRAGRDRPPSSATVARSVVRLI